ncbi:DMT family transporter [Rhodobacteraceae bacterium KMM 6894]|nr:DMT family transporter [Rhodobacteraceae bacterium KMM 6894]
MTTDTLSGRRANLLGSLWMITAMAGFAIEDSFLKMVANTVPVGQILILFGLGGVCVFATIALSNGQHLFPRAVLSKPMRIRVLFEITGRLFYTLAIALTPLSAATVILQATPLVVVAGAAVVFGESVGWRRWTAIAVGLAGVLVIVQPGSDSFSILSILAVLGMLGFAGRDLASRAAPRSLSTAILGVYGFGAMIVAGGLFSVWQGAAFVVPGTVAVLCLLAAVLVGTASYSCLMLAMRTGEVSAVTPFRYTRLLFGLALGVLWFGEQVTLAMGIGSGLIVLSGIFIMWRGRRSRT